MDRLIYTAVSGMSASMMRQRVIASNMANAQTIGFRAEVMEFTPTTLANASAEHPSLEVRTLNHSQVKGAMMREGSLIRTGRDLDLAVEGDAMLTVQQGDGSEGYTRRGDLSVSPAGVLQNGEGLPVMGLDGPITVPLGAAIAISPDGTVRAGNPDAPDQPPVEVGRIKLASVRGSKIEKDLSGVFKVIGGGVLPADETARVMPGALEQSNVNPSEVLVEMVEAQRLYDLRTKLVSTALDLDEGSASLMRLD